MQPVKSPSRWKQWFSLDRLVPITTILGAVIAIGLSFLNVIQLSIAEDIVLALLALLATDALTERLGILERMEKRICAPAEHTLRTRLDLPSVENQAGRASEICVISPAMATLIVIAPAFFEKKIRSNCEVKILLLNPDNEQAIHSCNLLSKAAITESRIRDTLKTLREIILTSGAEAKCEVKLSNVFIPFSMFAADLHRDSGSVVVEYHGYRTPDDLRPHVFLTAKDDLFWFNHYKEEFESAWSDGVEWEPLKGKEN